MGGDGHSQNCDGVGCIGGDVGNSGGGTNNSSEMKLVCYDRGLLGGNDKEL